MLILLALLYHLLWEIWRKFFRFWIDRQVTQIKCVVARFNHGSEAMASRACELYCLWSDFCTREWLGLPNIGYIAGKTQMTHFENLAFGPGEYAVRCGSVKLRISKVGLSQLDGSSLMGRAAFMRRLGLRWINLGSPRRLVALWIRLCVCSFMNTQLTTVAVSFIAAREMTNVGFFVCVCVDVGLEYVFQVEFAAAILTGEPPRLHMCF